MVLPVTISYLFLLSLPYAYEAKVDEGSITDSWLPNGCLYDDPQTPSDDISLRSNPDCGTTWSSPSAGNGVGVIIIDLTGQDDKSVSFSQFYVFNMVSDGCVTHLRTLVHPSLKSPAPVYPNYDTTAYPPSQDDATWSECVGWRVIGSGKQAPDRNKTRVSEIFNINSNSSRYLKIEAKNDGSCKTPNYIELRQIKLFS